MQDCTVTTDTARLDRDRIHHWMSAEAYWALGRSREAQDRAIDASLNVGVLGPDGVLLAYGRAVTDGATFAWVCDVFVDATARGRGLGKVVVERLCTELDGLGVPRALLATSSAHTLYEGYGWAAVEPPENWMIRLVRDRSA